ncbi:nucleotidyltransferase domain-containing protein [Candidatus Woesearchaeota archaeon]|nr:nucleotidyltransferase domain-containing protein [Candidatus Woesearchaeota archaeon]
MNKNELFSFLYDFIRFLTAQLKKEPPEIILFGSIARGDFHEESDIDLFINVKNKKEQRDIELIVKKAKIEFDNAAANSWSLKGINLPIKVIVGDLGSPRWSALKREIISTGKTIYGRYRELPAKLSHYYLLSFDLKNLQPKNKVKFIRQLYGYESRKEQKVYRSAGILQEKGIRINQNTILISTEHHNLFLGLFKQFKIKYQIRETWM